MQSMRALILIFYEHRRWSWYTVKKAELELELGGQVKEEFLFHGTNHAWIPTILKDGLDMRLSKPTGLLGTNPTVKFSLNVQAKESTSRKTHTIP